MLKKEPPQNYFWDGLFSVSILLLTLILLRLKSESINRISESLFGFLPKVDDNTLYRRACSKWPYGND